MSTSTKAAPAATFTTPALTTPGVRPVDAVDPDRSRRRARRQSIASVVVSTLVGIALGSFLYDLLTMSNEQNHIPPGPPDVVTITTPTGDVVQVVKDDKETPQEFAERVQAAVQTLGD